MMIRTAQRPIPTIHPEGIKPRLEAIEEEAIALFKSINRSGTYFLGPHVQQLETTMEHTWNIQRAIGTSSGTAALYLVYRALQERLIRDKVAVRDPGTGLVVLPGKNGKAATRPALVTTPLSSIATCYEASEAGYDLVFADIDPRTYTLNPQQVRRAFDTHANIVAIVPVHLYGQPADMASLLDIAQEKGVRVIEDAAQAIGATSPMDGHMHYVGSQSFMAITSFYAGKVIGCTGDAGAVFTSDPEMVEVLRAARDQGRLPAEQYVHHDAGGKYRMREFDAAVVALQLRSFPAWYARRYEIAQRYLAELGDLLGITPPQVSYDTVWYKFPILAPDAQARERLARHLEQLGIKTEQVYPTLIPSQPLYRQGRSPCSWIGQLPVAQDVTRRLLCLPMHEFLGDHDVTQVIRATQEAAQWCAARI